MSRPVSDLLAPQHFASIVAASEDAIISKDLQGRVLSWNPAAERIFGYRAEEMLGQPMTLIFPPDRLEEEVQILARLSRGERVEHFQTVRLHRSGRPVHVSVTISPIFGPDGQVVAASKIARDITAQVLSAQRAAALALASRHFEAIVESSDDAIIGKTLDGVITSWNRGAERIFGYSAEEMLGQTLAVLFPPDRSHEEAGILARIRHGEKVDHIETLRLHKSGRLIHISATISPILDEEGRVVGASKIARDITDRIAAERIIWRQANFDMLTQLPNRRQFHERLVRAVERAAKEGLRVAVLFVDLDRFKAINDNLGHQAGDTLLTLVAQRLRACVREADSVARLAGDEFVLLLPEVHSEVEADSVAERARRSLAEPFELGALRAQLGCSIGIAMYPRDAGTPDELLTQADQARVQAKQLGRSQVRHVVRSSASLPTGRGRLAEDMIHALAQDQFFLVYQPIYSMDGRRILRCEALLRWQHPVHGLIPPDVFIPLAEETCQIEPIGDWVFQRAVAQLRAWRESGATALQMSINLSPVQFLSNHRLAGRWLGVLADHGVPCDSVMLEITEGTVADRSPAALATLAELRRAGLQMAIDDFGTGYSALSYLTQLELSCLKIDKAFTRRLQPASKDLALCEAIVLMAHRLGLEVTAEGIETPLQHQLLRDMGCDHAQGFLFGRPVAPEVLGAQLVGA